MGESEPTESVHWSEVHYKSLQGQRIFFPCCSQVSNFKQYKSLKWNKPAILLKLSLFLNPRSTYTCFLEHISASTLTSMAKCSTITGWCTYDVQKVEYGIMVTSHPQWSQFWLCNRGTSKPVKMAAKEAATVAITLVNKQIGKYFCWCHLRLNFDSNAIDR